jgi:hypothetical protein
MLGVQAAFWPASPKLREGNGDGEAGGGQRWGDAVYSEEQMEINRRDGGQELRESAISAHVSRTELNPCC